MRTRSRRRLDILIIGAGGVALAGTTAFAAFGYDEERIEQMWVGAAVHEDGTATLREVIDYDFGNTPDRHGLLRRIPGLTPASPFAVESPTGAPDGVADITTHVFDGGEQGVEIKVGDPSRTVSGRHRYVLGYDLDTLVDADRIAWDAVGTDWDVPIKDTEVHLVAPWRLEDLMCFAGTPGSQEPCEDEPRQVEPGHLVVRVDDTVAEGDGVTITARRGAPLAAAPALPDDAATPDDEGAGIAEPAAVALVGALGGGLTMSRWVRRAGRERVGVGGAADAAFSDLGTSTSVRLVDSTELGGLATTDFAPPEGLTAPQGGMVLAEAVRPEHKVAWLLEQAIAGTVDLDDEGEQARLTRTAPGAGEVQEVLDAAFGGRDSITLGKYDSTFAAGWTKLGTQLDDWADASGLWDRAGDRRRTRVRVLGILGCIAAGLATAATGALYGRFGDVGWSVLLAAAAIGTGVGFAAAVRAWELRVRTPKGSAAWLRVESFRRFLHESEAFHAEEAAKRGVLREYTAWAVAVGEIDRWKRAVERSTVIPDTAGLHYVAMAPLLSHSTSSASTAPSSSGGGGGGVGGGGGGGGGGSW